MIAPYVYAAIAAVLLSLGFAGGFYLEHGLSASKLAAAQVQLSDQKAAYEKALADSVQHALDTEHAAASSQAKLVANYEEKLQNEKATNASTVADLRSGAERLRVKLAATAASKLPFIASSATGSDGGQIQTIAGPVAARLAQRYADYNEIVGQLALCQATVLNDRAAHP